MTLVLRANNTLVVTAWLQGVEGLDPNQIGSTVPGVDNWAEVGFVRHRVVGGTRHNYLPVAQPVVQIDCYAVNGSNSNYKPAWNKANHLAECIHAAAKDEASIRRLLTLPSGYPTVRLLEVHTGGEPQALDSDMGNAARFRMDMRFVWAEMS